MIDKKTANELIDSIISLGINHNDEDECKAEYELKSLDLPMRVKVFGIMAYWQGNGKMKTLYEMVKKIEQRLVKD